MELALALQRRTYLKANGRQYELTTGGKRWLEELGIDSEQLLAQPRALATQCLDWTERRSHIGGALGAALFTGVLKLGWLGKSRIPRLVRSQLKGNWN